MKLFGGSRYWQNAFAFQVLAFGWAAYVVSVSDAERLGLIVGPLALMLGGVGTTIFGLMGMVKRKEREPESQQAYLDRLRYEEQKGNGP